MARTLLRSAIVIWIISASIISRAEDPATIVRVQDQTQIGGIAGIVLLVNPGNFHNSKVFITDALGQASIPQMDCKICTISALDTRHLFYDKTTEYDGRSTSVTLTLELTPTDCRLWIPGSIDVTVTVFGPGGEPLPNQSVVIRPTVMKLDTESDSNRAVALITDSRGLVSAELVPGDYVIATIIGEKPWESTLRIVGIQSKCTAKMQKCIYSSLGATQPAQSMAAHLTATSATSQ
jgi:hypothetical protein